MTVPIKMLQFAIQKEFVKNVRIMLNVHLVQNASEI